MKKSTNVESKTVTFDDGAGNVQTFELDKCTPEIVIQLALHGASQKGGDSYAGARKAVEELDITIEDYAIQQVDNVISQLYAGDWNLRTGGGGPQITDLARAISEITGQPEAACIEMLGEQDKEMKKSLRADPKVKVILARLTAERAVKKAASAEKAAEGKESNLGDLFA